jgi:uncharacterized protein YutE (UPF0331/DUF86 family)
VTRSGVRLKIVRDRLAAVTEYVEALRELPQETEGGFLADRRNPDAAESLIRRALEGLFDVARHLLAKGVGRGALEYKEVAILALEHGLLPSPELGRLFREMAGFRNRLTHFYNEVTPGELYAVIRHELADIEAVSDALRDAAGRLAAAKEDSGESVGAEVTR